MGMARRPALSRNSTISRPEIPCSTRGFRLRIAPGGTAFQVRRISVAACIKRAFEWDKPYFERNLAEGKPFEDLFATFVMGLKMKTENTTRQECRLLFFDLLFLLYGSLSLAQEQRRLPQARAAAWPCLRTRLEEDMRRLFPCLVPPRRPGNRHDLQRYGSPFSGSVSSGPAD